MVYMFLLYIIRRWPQHANTYVFNFLNSLLLSSFVCSSRASVASTAFTVFLPRAVAAMNDPGLDKPIEIGARKPDEDREKEKEDEAEEDQTYMDPR